VPHRLPFLLDDSHRTSMGSNNTIYEYEDVAAAYLQRPGADWQRYPCVASGWDNSPRRQDGSALILRDSTPEGYGRWLTEAVRRQAEYASRDGIVFVNAWNEWAEGAHLEPDVQWGRAYLEATREVMRSVFGSTPAPEVVEPFDFVDTSAEDRYHALYEQFVALQQSRSGVLSYADRRITELRKNYKSLLAETQDESRRIAELNEAMAEQVKFLAERLRELGEDVPSMPWLFTP
jgi:hypothetical protein